MSLRKSARPLALAMPSMRGLYEPTYFRSLSSGFHLFMSAVSFRTRGHPVVDRPAGSQHGLDDARATSAAADAAPIASTTSALEGWWFCSSSLLEVMIMP